MFACDAAIVGGGPAGGAAAIWCLHHGLDVVLVEALAFPRDRPGESLHPGIEPLFDQLGVGDAVRSAGFLRYRGHRVEWGGPARFDAFGEDAHGPWLGFQAWRADLDSILLRRAAAAGARVLQPCRAQAPIIEAGRMVGIESDAGEIRARFVIDGSGSRHWLRRMAGVPMRRASRRLIATFGHVRDPGGEIGVQPVLSGDRWGWCWVARVRPDLVAWTQLDFTKLRRSAPEALSEMRQEGAVRGADVTWRILETCAGAGYFAIGDAAAVLDPAASHGVLKAIMSGILAADLIAQVVRGATAESAAVAVFQGWTRGWFERDSRKLRELYAAAHAAESLAGNARINLLR